MNKGRDQFEKLWEDILSRQPGLIQAAFDSLEKPDQQMVMLHLQRMVEEDGWQPEQRISAQTALDTLVARPGQEG